MLYPKEDRQNRALLFACRNCDHQEEASHYCVYRHDIILPVMYYFYYLVLFYVYLIFLENSRGHILIFPQILLCQGRIKDLVLNVDIRRQSFSKLTIEDAIPL